MSWAEQPSGPSEESSLEGEWTLSPRVLTVGGASSAGTKPARTKHVPHLGMGP